MSTHYLAASVLMLSLFSLPQGNAAEPNSSNRSGAGSAPAKSNTVLEETLKKPSAQWNQGLPNWLRVNGEFRTRGEGRTAISYAEGDDDAYVLTRFRVKLDAQPASWLRFFAEGQDSRVGAIDAKRATSSVKNSMDLRQGYVHFRDREEGWFGLRVGRQELKYGDGRLVYSSDWSNVSRTYDGARLELGTTDRRVDVFAVGVVRIDPGNFDKVRDGENLYGAYGSLKKTVPLSVVEPFLLYKTDPRVVGERANIADLDVYTAGFRVASAEPPAKLLGFDYSAQIARQWGSFASDDLSAWAGSWALGYNLLPVVMQPRLLVEFNYASGDSARRDGKVGTFDNLYPSNHKVYGIADRVGWRNIQNLRTGVEIKPRKKLKLAVDYHWFWLANRNDHFYDSSGKIAARTPSGGAVHSDIGEELDIQALYSPASVLDIGIGFAHLFPGRFLKEASPGASTSYPYGYVNYKF